MARHPNVAWDIPDPIGSTNHAICAVLMDIRDELQRLNRAIYCPNFQAIPKTLARISRHTAKPTRQRVKGR